LAAEVKRSDFSRTAFFLAADEEGRQFFGQSFLGETDLSSL
jgi:hypothetical protein